jgi:hypothetical protein
MSRWSWSLLLAAVVVVGFAWPSTALGRLPSEGDMALLSSADAALSKGATTEAIDHFELLADQGVMHPDVSFDRAVAYVRRGRSSAAHPSDLGRGAAALHETLRLRPGDAQASALLDRLNSELARIRSRTGASSLLIRPRLFRAMVGLIPENTWGLLGAVGSLALTLGLVLRLWSRRHRLRLAGAIGAWIGLGLVVVGSTMQYSAAVGRRSTDEAVVVVPEARLLDASGKPLRRSGKAAEDGTIPIGAVVTMVRTEARLSRLEWGDAEAYVDRSQLQYLPRCP